MSQKFENGDTVMANKGFQIADILPFGVKLNIPPFLGANTQMSAEDVVQTQQIAGLRIHVERAINKIKNFLIWKGEIPLCLFSVVNQMWSVCLFVQYTRSTNFGIVCIIPGKGGRGCDMKQTGMLFILLI